MSGYNIRMALTRGVVYHMKKQLYVDFTAACRGVPLLVQRGPGFSMLADGFIPLGHADRQTLTDPSVPDIFAAIDAVYEAGYDIPATREDELHGVCFAGLGDPLCRLEDLVKTCQGLQDKRPGAPIRVNTLGLIGNEDTQTVVCKLKDSGVETLSVCIGTSNPAQYDTLIQPDEGLGFSNVCGFILAAVENELNVVCSAVTHPSVDITSVRQLSESLGADFISREYFP